MGDTQLAVLDHTFQLTNVWLKKMMAEHHFETRMTPMAPYARSCVLCEIA